MADEAPAPAPAVPYAQVQAAREAGYTDTQIANHIASITGQDLTAARKAGYDDEQILNHLAPKPTPKPEPPPDDSTTLGAMGRAAGQETVEGAGKTVSGVGAVTKTIGGAERKAESAALDLYQKFDAGEDFAKLMKSAPNGMDRLALGEYRQATPEQRQAIKQRAINTAASPENQIELSGEHMRKAGEAIAEGGKQTFPLTPEEEQRPEVIATKMVASFGKYVVAAVAGGMPTMVGLAGIDAYGETMDKAATAGATEEEREKAALMNAATQGALMMLPIGQATKLFDTVPPELRGKFLQALTEAAPVLKSKIAGVVAKGGEGAAVGTAFTQVSTLADNVIAQNTYDPSRKTTQGLGENMLEIAAAGAVLPVVGAGANRLLRGKAPLPNPDPVLKAPDVDTAIKQAGAVADGAPATDVGEAIRQATEAGNEQHAKTLKLFSGMNDGEIRPTEDGGFAYHAGEKEFPLEVWDEKAPAAEGETAPATISPDLAQTVRDTYARMGVDVVYLKDPDGKAPFDGAVDPNQPNTIFLSNNPQRIATMVAGHEVGHLLENTLMPDGTTRAADVLHDLIQRGLTPEGRAQATAFFGRREAGAPQREAFPEGPEGDAAHADALERHVINELGADLHGEAPMFQSYIDKVVDEVHARYGIDAAKDVVRKLADGIRQALNRLREFFFKPTELTEHGPPDATASRLVTNLEEIHDHLAKVDAQRFGTQAEKENVALAEVRDRGQRNKAVAEGVKQPAEGVEAPKAPEVQPTPETAPAAKPANPEGAANDYEASRQKAATYGRWLREMHAERLVPPGSEREKLLRQTEAHILARAPGRDENALPGPAKARLAAVREELAPTTDTPAMAKIRAAQAAEHGRMVNAITEAAKFSPKEEGAPKEKPFTWEEIKRIVPAIRHEFPDGRVTIHEGERGETHLEPAMRAARELGDAADEKGVKFDDGFYDPKTKRYYTRDQMLERQGPDEALDLADRQGLPTKFSPKEDEEAQARANPEHPESPFAQSMKKAAERHEALATQHEAEARKAREAGDERLAEQHDRAAGQHGGAAYLAGVQGRGGKLQARDEDRLDALRQSAMRESTRLLPDEGGVKMSPKVVDLTERIERRQREKAGTMGRDQPPTVTKEELSGLSDKDLDALHAHIETGALGSARETAGLYDQIQNELDARGRGAMQDRTANDERPKFSPKKGTPGPNAPGVGVEDRNRLGFVPELRVAVTKPPAALPPKALLTQETTNRNAAAQIANIDHILERFPNATRNAAEWARMEAYAFASNEVPIPPYAFLRDLNSDRAAKKVGSLTPGQIEDANHGFEAGRAFRKAYEGGELAPTTTGKLFLWSFLSRGIAPYNQEAMFLDAFHGADHWIAKAARGDFTEADLPAYYEWATTMAPKGSGLPGAGAKSNLNAFGRDFLIKMGARDESGVSNLQRLHDMMSDPEMTGQKIRREFLKFGEGVGIDNKVVSFTLLVAGHTDVMVIDRVQTRQLWDDGRFPEKEINLYDGRKNEEGKAVTGTALSDLTYGARGLLVYEAIERGLQDKIYGIYEAAGRPRDASIGRYHWESWVAYSQQEASHGTLASVLAEGRGANAPTADIAAKQGEYGSYEYGARYARDVEGKPYFEYKTPLGNEYRFSVPAFRSFLEAIKKPGTGVRPANFKVTESSNAPWYNRPEVNQSRLDEVARAWADQRRPAGEGEGAVRPTGEGQAVPDRAGPAEGRVAFSPKQTEEPFFSSLKRGVEGLKLEKGTPGQWEATIKNMSGVKAEERAWVGVEDWLRAQTKPVTKAEVLDYIAEHEVKIGEVMHGGERAALGAPAAEGYEIRYDRRTGFHDVYRNGEVLRDPDGAEMGFDTEALARQHIERLVEAGGSATTLPVKFGSYTLPGGKNYRELLMTLPDRGTVHKEFPQRWIDVARNPRDNMWHRIDAAGARDVVGYDSRAAALRGLELHRQAAREGLEESANFRGGHWEEPNVLAHARFDERTGPNGEKILHVAEIQSDWHQKGRREGYDNEAAFQDLIKRRDAEQGDTPLRDELQRQIDEMGRTGNKGVPDAPFKTSWPELAMKRVLRYAAENGYDRVSWDTGQTNADRYDLSKEVRSIIVTPRTDASTGERTRSVAIDLRNDNSNTGYMELGVDKNGIIDNVSRHGPDVKGKSLADVVGKEIAEKIMANDRQTIEGEGLKVGGEGMRAFYDKQLPTIAGKIGKRFVAKVEDTAVNKTEVQETDYGVEKLDDGKWHVTGADYESPPFASYAEAQKMLRDFMKEGASTEQAHSIEITPAMRESVMQGQPLFSPRLTGETHVKDAATLAAYERLGRTTQPETIQERWKKATDQIGKRALIATVDKYLAAKSIDPLGYMALRNFNSSAGALEVLLTKATLRFNGLAFDFDKRNGGVEAQVIRPLKGEHDDWAWWVAGHRAERLSAEDRENLFTPEDIARLKATNQGELKFDYTLRNGKTTRSREAAYLDTLAKYDEFNKNVMALGVKAGLFKQDTVDKLWSNPFYVPFFRAAEGEKEGLFVGGGKTNGFTKQYGFKALKGGSAKLHNDLWQNIIGNWGHLIDSAGKNMAANRVLDTASSPANGAVSKVTEQDYNHKMTKAEKADTTWTMVDGKKQYWHIDDPLLFDAISAIHSTHFNDPISKTTNFFARTLRMGVTSDPGFMLRVTIKDSLQAVAVAPMNYNVLANVVKGYKMADLPRALANIARAAAGQHDQALRESDELVSVMAGGGLMRLGAGHAEGFRKTTAETLSGRDLTWADGISYVKRLATGYKEAIAQSEDVNRAALYSEMRRRGMSHDEASFAARDLEDFTLSGAAPWVRWIAQSVTFLNAGAQGLYKVGRAAADADKNVISAVAGNATMRVAKVMAATVIATVALDYIYRNDEDYKKRSEYDRNSKWWFKVGNKQFQIPMGFELAGLARIAANGVDMFFDKEMTGERFRKNALSIIGQNMFLNPTPTILAPALEVYANEGGTGRPIEPKGMENLQQEQKYTSEDTLAARGLSTVANKVARGVFGPNASAPSPIQMDYLWNAYTGWLGSAILGSADRVARQFTNVPVRPAQDMWNVATRGIVASLPTSQSRYIDTMYEQAEAVDKAYGTYMDLIKRQDPKAAQRFFENNKDAIIRHGMVDSVVRSEAALNQQIRMIQNNPDPRMTAALKRVQIMELQKVRNQLAESAFGKR